MADIDFSGVFAESSETQGAAAPETDNENQEVVEPENPEGSEGSEEPEGAEEPEGVEESEDGKGQSAEENAKFAALRRKYERQREEAVEKALNEAKGQEKNQLDAMVAEIGLLNPYTDKPVSNFDEMKAYLEASREESTKNIESHMEEAGLSRDEFKKLIDNHPDVLKARRLSAEAAREKEVADKQAAKLKMEESVAEIGKLYPEIKTVEDFAKHKSFPEVYEKVKQGYSITDAFKVVNFNDIAERDAVAAAQKTRNSIASKSHLDKTPANAGEGIKISDAEMASFREMMPKASDEEIRKFYARDRARMKKK